MGDVLIPELQRGNTSVTICARVSRLWDFCDPQDEAKLLHCDMVLLDEEGNGIHAAIFPPVIQKFKPLIKEGVVYNITYFRVRASNNLYKPVFNENMITFTNWTKLEEVVEVPPAFPVLTYSLTPIDQLHLCVDHREYYTDAIGIVTSISAVAPHRSRGQHTTSSKRTISLCSVSNNSSVNVVLWGGQASLFPGEQIYNDGQSSPQILMFVGMLVKKYADGLCLSGGSPCKWYINPDVPEACALMASARKAHSPIKWNEVLSSNQPMPHVPEEQKIACIRDLHPFENKDREFLVTVTVKKIGDRWWYNACKKCTRTTVAHGDSYKCSDQVCATIGTPNQRYKLLLTAGDEMGDTDFILFGRMAQRIIKRPCHMLIANNSTDFIPNPITDLLKKTYVWNVSFSDHTINTGNICFQVNAVVAEIGTAKDSIQSSSSGPKQSQTMLLQGVPSGIEDTPDKASNLVMLSTPLTPQSSPTSVQDKTIGIGSSTAVPSGTPAITKELTSTPRKRTRSSPAKTVTKMLFTDIDGGTTGFKDAADNTAAPSPSKDA